MSSDTEKKIRILILGGGFAGVYTAMYLEKALRRSERDQIQISIVSHENYIVFQPFLPEIISGAIETLHAITPIRRLAKRARLHTREIQAIDIEAKTVTLAPEYVPKPITLHFDHLVIGLGTRLNYDLVPGMREHAIPFKYLGDALRLRNEAVGKLEEADNETDPVEKKRLLTFIVGGGGFSGVECVAELHDFLTRAESAYPNVAKSEIRCILLQSGSRILPEVKENLAKYAQRVLVRRGIDVRLNTRLKVVTANGALIQDKTTKELEMLSSRTVVSTVPSTTHALIANLPCEMERGKIKVDQYLDVVDWDGIWALGDCASVPQRDGITSPPTAQHALRQAKTCAHNILADIRGEARKPFLFTGLGSLASLGRGAAVAEVFGLKLSGFIAWFLWRGIYLMKFPGFDRKIRIAIDWTIDFIFPRDITQVRIFQPEAVVQEHFHEGDIIFDEGDFGNKLSVIVNGEVEVLRGDRVVATFGPEEVFGEIALIEDRPRTATIRAKTSVDVITISRSAFKQLITHLPGVKPTIEKIMTQHLGRMVDLEKEIIDDETGEAGEQAAPESQ